MASATPAVDVTTQPIPCPYCGTPLHWTPPTWGRRGAFDCDRCGKFPDLRIPEISASLQTSPSADPIPHRS